MSRTKVHLVSGIVACALFASVQDRAARGAESERERVEAAIEQIGSCAKRAQRAMAEFQAATRKATAERENGSLTEAAFAEAYKAALAKCRKQLEADLAEARKQDRIVHAASERLPEKRVATSLAGFGVGYLEELEMALGVATRVLASRATPEQFDEALAKAEATARRARDLHDTYRSQLRGEAAPAAPQATKASFVAVTRPPSPGAYEHPSRRCLLRFPESWRLLRSITNGRTCYTLTPETEATDPHQVRAAFHVQLLCLPPQSALADKTATGVLEHLMPAFRHAQPRMAPEGRVTEAELGDLPGATFTARGTLKGREGEFISQSFLAEDEGVTFFAVAQAPSAQYPELREAFRRIVRRSRFGRERQARRERSLESQHIVRKYKGSVVSVVAETGEAGGTGSGFLISKSGYVLTNWHVIWNDEAEKPHERFYVEWDDSLRRTRRKTPARLVEYRRKESAFFYHHGEDVALLKIAPGDYEPMPLTPLADVEVGDRVVTLGFPKRGLLEGASITVTTGVVTRLNRRPDGVVETILTDAAITHGCSGGPCVSLVTGGVIGLNTYGMGVVLDKRAQELNDLLNYNGVVPVDACLRAFPLETVLGLTDRGRGLDFFDAYELALLFKSLGSYNAAWSLARRAAGLKPRLADAQCLAGSCTLSWQIDALDAPEPAAVAKLIPEVLPFFTAALECDPTHTPSLGSLAALHLQLAKPDEAARYADRAIQAAPDAWENYQTRARAAMAKKQYDEALRYAHQAKRAALELVPEPYVLAGNIQYLRNDLAAGRDEFLRAVRIHPMDLGARLGVAQYHEFSKQTDAAVAEYKRILEDFRENPEVLAAIGACYFVAKKYDQALPYLRNGIDRFQQLGITPPAEPFLELIGIHMERKATDAAISACAALLGCHGKGAHAQGIHLRAAILQASKQRFGIVSSHLGRAKALGDSPEVLQALRVTRPTRLSLAEIKQMLELAYPTPVAFDLICHSRLDFTIRSEQDIERLKDREGLPPPLILAILYSQQHQGQ